LTLEIMMVPRWSTDRRATRPGHSFLLVQPRSGRRLPVEFALRGLIQPERIEHVSGPYDLVVKLSPDSDIDWLNDLPGVDNFAVLEPTSANGRLWS
jgi:hypothetical protein